MVLSETRSTELTSPPCSAGFTLQALDGTGTATTQSEEGTI